MTRTRRDHMKFLTLIQAIALMYQHQREIKTSVEDGETLEYIEATEADVKLAWELASHVLMRSLDDVQTQTRPPAARDRQDGDGGMRAASNRTARLPLHAGHGTAVHGWETHS